jgi:hypothetical protein
MSPVGPIAIRCRTGSPLFVPTRSEHFIFSPLCQDGPSSYRSYSYRFTWTCFRSGDIIQPYETLGAQSPRRQS